MITSFWSRKSRRGLQCVGLLLMLLGVSLGSSGPAASQIEANPRRDLTPEQWRDDLHALASALKQRHVNPFHTITEEAFDAAVQALDGRIPQLSDTATTIEFERIGALIGDGHTKVLPLHTFRFFPLRLYAFADGMFVQASSPAYGELVGARVVRIGGLSVEVVYDRVKALWGADNEWGVREFVPRHHLVRADVLHSLGITEQATTASFVFEIDGEERAVEVHATLEGIFPSELGGAVGAAASSDWVDMREATPLWLRDQETPYWYAHLPDIGLLYLQINAMREGSDEPFESFVERLFASLDTTSVERFVIDLRHNGGGNHFMMLPLLTRLIGSELNASGHLFVLIGRLTFSAAQVFLNKLEVYTEAIIVGEPTGGRPHMYGEDVHVRLPHSNMLLRIAQERWQSPWGWDPRRWTAPHVAAELTSGQYRMGVDPALEAVLTYTPQEAPNVRFAEAGRDVAAFVDWYLRYRADPAHVFFDGFRVGPTYFFMESEAAVEQLGRRLMERGRFRESLALFDMNAEFYPSSAQAQTSLGTIYHRLGDTDRAAMHYQRALDLDAGHTPARALLDQLTDGS